MEERRSCLVSFGPVLLVAKVGFDLEGFVRDARGEEDMGFCVLCSGLCESFPFCFLVVVLLATTVEDRSGGMRGTEEGKRLGVSGELIGWMH